MDHPSSARNFWKNLELSIQQKVEETQKKIVDTLSPRSHNSHHSKKEEKVTIPEKKQQPTLMESPDSSSIFEQNVASILQRIESSNNAEISMETGLGGFHALVKGFIYSPEKMEECPIQEENEIVPELVNEQIFWTVFERTMAKGPNVDIVDGRGRTALMYACKYGQFELIKKLVKDHGADTFLVDKQGRKCHEYLKEGSEESKFLKNWAKIHRFPSTNTFQFETLSPVLKPFLTDHTLTIPKVLSKKIDLSKKQYSAFVALLKDSMAQDLVRMRNFQTQRPPYQRPDKEQRTFNILSLDGGGIRALTTALVVEELWKKVPGLLDRIDLIVGSSGGSVVAAGLANGFSPTFVSHLFEEGAKKTFEHKKSSTSGITDAKYSRKWMKLGYFLIVGESKMKDLKKKLLIPAWKMEDNDSPVQSWGPKIFHNLETQNNPHMDEYIVDLILRSSAAPIYFASYQGYIDCGVFANNPLSVTLPIIIGKGPEGLGIPINKVRVLSIGTGISYNHIITHHRLESEESADWGVVQWAPKMIDLLFDGQAKTTDYLSQRMLGSNYHRVNPPIDRNRKSMDDVTLVPMLKEEVLKLPLGDTVEWVEKNFL